MKERRSLSSNHAGISNAADRDPDRFAMTLDVTLVGAPRVAAAAHAPLARSCGCVVNIASIYALIGSPGGYGCAASNAGPAAGPGKQRQVRVMPPSAMNSWPFTKPVFRPAR